MRVLRRLFHLPIRWSACLGAVALLAGCASAPPPPPPVQGALLVVRLAQVLEPPASLRLEVALAGETSGTAVSARLQQSVPGQYADYLVALALPPQRYVLTGLQAYDKTAAEASGKADQPRLLALLNVPFEVPATEPVYLGRLIVPPGGAASPTVFAIEDHFDEDTVQFRSAVAELREAKIGKQLIAPQALAAAQLAPPPTPEPVGAQMVVTPVTPASAELLVPRARNAFAGFLRLKPPRAFAISDADGYGYANGAQAVERALRACIRRSQAPTVCRMFAVDDTLIDRDSCQVTLASGAKKAAVDAGCAPTLPAAQ